MGKMIPQKVKEKATVLIDMYGDNIEFIGKYQDCDVYQYMFPKNTETGYPFVFLYNGNDDVIEITGLESFEIIRTAKGLHE